MKHYTENEKLLLAKLRETGPTTKYILAEKLGISIPTVTTNINKLINCGIIHEVGVAQVDFGRKPILLDINYDACYSIGIDIQNKSIYYCVMNLKLQTIIEGFIFKKPIPLLETLENVIFRSLDDVNSDLSHLIGIGISYPGIVDSENLILKTATNIGIDAIDITYLQEKLQVPIKLGNEANLAAFAENIIGVSKSFNNSIYLSINEGIGGGIILDKHYYSGSFNAAGEIGHMIIQKNGLHCSCGASGCLEAYLSTNRLIEQFNTLLPLKVDNLDELFREYDSCNNEHITILKDYLDYLIIALNNLFLIFDPDSIILGGQLSAYKTYIEEYISQALLLNASRLLSKKRQINFSSLGYKASKLGAALVALEAITTLT